MDRRTAMGAAGKGAFFMMERRQTMQLVGQTVIHKIFEQGVVTDCSGNIVTVSFPQGDKKFVYPDAFIHFLTLQNQSAQNKFDALYNRRMEEEAEEKQMRQKEQERRRRLRALKITPNSQAAFDVDLSDLDEIFSSGALSTGCYLSGYSKGEPRTPSKLRPNSACLLTGCPADAPEKERRILGAFMVRDDFWGDLCVDGLVKSHQQHKIRLQPDSRLRYWDYFEGSDPLPRWGGVVFKYFSVGTMQKILLAMQKAVHGAGEKAAVQKFDEYFCAINRLTQ